MKQLMVALFLVLALGLRAQISFQHGTFQEAVALAKKENKPLFVDVFAEWCGPCKYMARTAFVDEELGKLFNEQFIALKLDGEKNDGPQIMQQFNITAYPTLLFFYPDGSLASKEIGAMDADQLKTKAMLCLNPSSNPLFLARKKYFSSTKTREDQKKYLAVLAQYDLDSLESYAQQYYISFPDLNLNDSTEFEVFLDQEHDYSSPLSKLFLANIKKYDHDKAIEKLSLFIQQAFLTGVGMNDFAYTEYAVREIFVYLELLNAEGLPNVDDFITYLQEEYTNAVKKE
jgi:thiol-disulfide isomerase/thioredoxin